jgi:hypothetical protein
LRAQALGVLRHVLLWLGRDPADVDDLESRKIKPLECPLIRAQAAEYMNARFAAVHFFHTQNGFTTTTIKKKITVTAMPW